MKPNHIIDRFVPTIATAIYLLMKVASLVIRCIPSRKKERYQLKDSEAEVALDRYDKMMLPVTAVSTVTFFSGESCRDYITTRIGEIVGANPWLGGRLVISADENGAAIPTVIYNASNPIFSDLVFMTSDPSISLSLPNDLLSEKVSPFLIKTGRECLNKLEPLFRVTVITISPSEFAIVFSMSHMLGDGETFYKLHKMLSRSAKVESLSTDRHSSTTHFQRKALIGDTDSWKSSSALIANLISNIIAQKVKNKNQTPMFVREVDLSWVEKEKQKWATSDSSSSSVSFVSTNDILSSHLFNAFGCPTATMVVNLRRKLILPNPTRVATLTDRDAGNHWDVMIYSRPDFATPTRIRQSVQFLRPAVSTSFPGLFSTLFSRKSSITNWVMFYDDDLNLPGCAQLSHLPVFWKYHPAFSALVVVFRPAKGRVAIHVNSDYISPEILDKEPYIKPFVPLQ